MTDDDLYPPGTVVTRENGILAVLILDAWREADDAGTD